MNSCSEPLPALLPKGWPKHVKSALLQAISLAHFAIVQVRGWAADSMVTRGRLTVQLGHAKSEIALLREEPRIKDARMGALPAHRRPHYLPAERMAILELKAARGWSLSQAARVFLVTTATVSQWLRRVDESSPLALVQLHEPINKFPDFVRLLVQRLKALCHAMGKVQIVQTLARAGLHLGATTVGRLLKETSPAGQSPQHIITDKGCQSYCVSSRPGANTVASSLASTPSVSTGALPSSNDSSAVSKASAHGDYYSCQCGRKRFSASSTYSVPCTMSTVLTRR